MNTNKEGRVIFTLSIILAVLVIFVSCIGLFVPGIYSQETPNWTAQAIGQDFFDLFLIVPFLIVTSFLAYKKTKTAMLLWSGAVFYLIYTFVIYCFAIHFNSLFIFYCLILGLSLYCFVYFLYSHIRKPIADWFSDKIPVRAVGFYLIAIAGVFYLLWLSEVVPAMIANTTPNNIIDMGLLTNPVHALDLAIVLPGFFIVAILLLRKKSLGLLLASTLLVFLILMDITIGGLNIVMEIRGLEASYGITIVMAILALIGIALLSFYLKSMRRGA